MYCNVAGFLCRLTYSDRYVVRRLEDITFICASFVLVAVELHPRDYDLLLVRF